MVIADVGKLSSERPMIYKTVAHVVEMLRGLPVYDGEQKYLRKLLLANKE
jgi:hypothetical protein